MKEEKKDGREERKKERTKKKGYVSTVSSFEPQDSLSKIN